ncbi:MAG TPA: Gfo/Idh/MocA family oxidoreductase [Chloroflexia bacterium]|jgi:predicted dehydrogenase|nr:Gfo/Idh/MocA family oxidoreductase [Chloroflexia bacterium]
MNGLAAVSSVGAAGGSGQGVAQRKPRLGFLGLGWIGRHRMEAMSGSGCIEVAALADPAIETAAQAAEIAPHATLMSGLDDLLAANLDGLVIATPSALHAGQSIAALERGLAVFCQKPLARDAAETRRVVEAARAADRLLSVDLSYRYVAGMDRVRDLIRGGELGEVFAANLVFHNAYGPDKPWFYNPQLSGGGCVIDLGIHLVDLALWMLDFPSVVDVQSSLYAGGVPLSGRTDTVEDYAVAGLRLSSGASMQLACSWRLQAGRDAIIEASFYGTQGGAALRNVGGSFYDFTVERYRGTSTEVLSSPPDEWGGRAAVDWATRLAAGERYDPSIERIVDVAAALDGVYGR